MALAEVPSRFADHLRWWRHHRRLSQLDLANVAGVSAKHISFLEVGRSEPSREMVLHLARHLDVPVRHRNDILAAAGFAPAFGDRPLHDDTMTDVRRVVELQLAHQEPFPAVCVDRHWNVLDANEAAGLFLDGVAPEVIEPQLNVLRLSLHPDGLAPHVRNFPAYAAHLLSQVSRQAASAVDPELDALLDELRSYPNLLTDPPSDHGHGAVLPLLLDHHGIDLAFLSTITTIGAPLDVTTAELAIESFYPADETTRDWLVEAGGAAAPT